MKLKCLNFDNFIVLFSILLLYSCKADNSKSDASILAELSNQYKFENNFIYKSWDSNLDLDLILVDSYDKKISLKNITKVDNYLIYRISNIDCSPCIGDELRIFDEKVDKLIYIVSTKNLRHFKSFCNNHEGKKCFLVPENSLNIPIEQIGKPYIFLLKKNNNTPFCFFIPKKEFIDLTYQYINIIENKL